MNQIFTCRRTFSTSFRRNFFLRDLFDHFRHAQKAKENLKKRNIDFNHLTDKQKVQLEPILRIKKIFSFMHVTMACLAISAFSVWFYRRRRATQHEQRVEAQFRPTWLSLKHFQHRAASIKNYILPEQIVKELPSIEEIEFTENDIVCASFPKSGTTLLQEIVFLLETNFDWQQAKAKDISERFRFIEWPTQSRTWTKESRTEKKRFFKTHLPPTFFNDSFRKSKVIYIYRNPKDVTVSFFHFLRSIKIELNYDGPWDEFVRSFLLDEVYYAPWSSHVNDYSSMAASSVCLVSYEDLLTNFGETVRRIARFLGKENLLTDEKLSELERWCSVESMKKNPRVNYSWMKDYGFVKQSFNFIRKGEIGDWLNHFSVEQSKEFDKMVANRVSHSINRFNYGISEEKLDLLYQFEKGDK